MIFDATPLAGSFVISLTPHGDSRGWFARTYCKDEFKTIGHTSEWVQMNHSFSTPKGTLRGMHFQLPPHGEVKLVRCVAGAVFDQIIDLRKDSPTFLQIFGVELSAENKKMLYIPVGFAHGFQTLQSNTELIYHHTEMYNPNAESGIRFDDPMIKLNWPLPITELSERDKNHPLLNSMFKGI